MSPARWSAKGEPPPLSRPCRSKVALLRWFARIAPVAPQGIVAASATGGAPIPCPSKEGNYGVGEQILFSPPLLSSANLSPTPSALRCPKKSSRCSLTRFFRPLRMLRLAASATGSARLRIPLTATRFTPSTRPFAAVRRAASQRQPCGACPPAVR